MSSKTLATLAIQYEQGETEVSQLQKLEQKKQEELSTLRASISLKQKQQEERWQEIRHFVNCSEDADRTVQTKTNDHLPPTRSLDRSTTSPSLNHDGLGKTNEDNPHVVTQQTGDQETSTRSDTQENTLQHVPARLTQRPSSNQNADEFYLCRDGQTVTIESLKAHSDHPLIYRDPDRDVLVALSCSICGTNCVKLKSKNDVPTLFEKFMHLRHHMIVAHKVKSNGETLTMSDALRKCFSRGVVLTADESAAVQAGRDEYVPKTFPQPLRTGKSRKRTREEFESIRQNSTQENVQHEASGDNEGRPRTLGKAIRHSRKARLPSVSSDNSEDGPDSIPSQGPTVNSTGAEHRERTPLEYEPIE